MSGIMFPLNMTFLWLSGFKENRRHGTDRRTDCGTGTCNFYKCGPYRESHQWQQSR